MQYNRLDAICSLLNASDKLIDIGCDHAYVSIDLAKKGAKKILATDIHEKALNVAKKNIEANGLQNIITCQLSDGLENIDTTNFNTIVIAGMGTSTIKHILSNQEKRKPIIKIIVQSNNDLPELRSFMNQAGFAIQKEIVVLEKKHFYTIILYKKAKQKLKKRELEFGFFQENLQEYYDYLLKKYETILKEVPKKKIKKRYQLKKKIKWLNKWKKL